MNRFLLKIYSVLGSRPLTVDIGDSVFSIRRVVNHFIKSENPTAIYSRVIWRSGISI